MSRGWLVGGIFVYLSRASRAMTWLANQKADIFIPMYMLIPVYDGMSLVARLLKWSGLCGIQMIIIFYCESGYVA